MTTGIGNDEKSKVRQLYAEGKVGRAELLESESKAYHGPGFEEFLSQLKRQFKTVASRKPEASRDRSAEVFLLSTGLR